MGYEKYTSKAFEGFEKLWKKFLNIFAFGVLHDKILVCFQEKETEVISNNYLEVQLFFQIGTGVGKKTVQLHVQLCVFFCISFMCAFSMSKQNGEIFMKDKARTEDTFEFLL